MEETAYSAREKAASALTCAAFVVYTAFPVFYLLGTLVFKVDAYISSTLIWAAILLLFAVSELVISIKKQPLSKSAKLMLGLLPALAVVNWLLILDNSAEDHIIELIFTVGMLICCLVITAYVSFKSTGKGKWASMIIPCVIALPLCVLSFFAIFFGTIGETTVVERVISPDGTKYAEILDDDQGALGGNTYVSVRRNIDGGVLIFRWKALPTYVYQGKWGEFQDMKLEWKDDDTLLIDGKEYGINGSGPR